MKKKMSIVVGALCALLSYSNVQAAPGDLDTATFNPSGLISGIPGLVTDDIANSGFSRGNAVLIQPDDQKIIAVGSTRGGGPTNLHVSFISGNYVLARFETDGSLDASFGNSSGNEVTPLFLNSLSDQANAAVLQPDGKIIAAGTSLSTVEIISSNVFSLARYTKEGALDPDFNTMGYVVLPQFLNVNSSSINAVGLQSDGKIVVAGYANQIGQSMIALMRFNTNGSVDNSFGPNGDGTVFTSFGPNTYNIARGIAIQDDDKIVVAGNTTESSVTNFALVKYDKDGNPDSSFGTAGLLKVPNFSGSTDDEASAVVIQSDHKIVAAGTLWTSPNILLGLFRCDSQGNPDATFGTGGYVSTTYSPNDVFGTSMLLQANEKIVVGGFAGTNNNNFNISLARYKSDGSLDTSIGNGGQVLTTFATVTDAFGIAIQKDGKIVTVGDFGEGRIASVDSVQSQARFFSEFAVARFLGDTANLSLTKTANVSSVEVGSDITYTLTVMNAGPDDSGVAVLTDALPSNLTYVSVSTSQGTCLRGGRGREGAVS